MEELKIIAEFNDLKADLTKWGAFVDDIIKEKVNDYNFGDIQIGPKFRLKGDDSFIHKALHRQKGYENPLLNIEDKIGTRIIGYIPTTSEILWKTSYIVTVGIHQTEVTVSLQQSCCQLCVRVELVHLGLVGIDVAQGIIRARSHRSAGCHQGESHHQAALTYIFLDYIVHFLTLLYIRTLLKKLIHFFRD